MEPFDSDPFKEVLSDLDVPVVSPVRVGEVRCDIGIFRDTGRRIVCAVTCPVGPSRGYDKAAETEEEEQSDQAYDGNVPARRVQAAPAGAGRGFPRRLGHDRLALREYKVQGRGLLIHKALFWLCVC